MSNAIELDRVAKRYGATVALSDASFSVATGAVHAILGENGAGKSTLVKILSGIVQPDAGTIRLFGEARALPSREASSRLGLETAFQEIPLVPDLSVQANLLLPRHPMRFGIFHDWRASRRKVEEIQAALEIDDIAPDALVRDLDLSQRQKVEIASAISRKPRILILDEPTASLSLNDVEWLGRRIRALEAVGTTIILVTHRMQEVRDFCGRLSVLRNGAHVGSLAVGEASDAEVFRLIMGRAVDVTFPPRPAPTSQGRPLLGARAIEVGSRLRGVSLDLSAGEVVGIAGLQGMGQLALFNALFGAEPVTRGTLSIEGREVAIRSPRDAIRLGVGLVPEDRKIQGLALRLSGSANASLPIVSEFSHQGLVDEALERSMVDTVFAAVNLHPRALYQAAGSFSGGNQQKIVLAKWLLTRCRVLLAFDPTRGVDVGTKHEIYGLLRDFAGRGGAVLFHSTELPELIGLCDRILILYRGRIIAEVQAGDYSEEHIGAAMLGAQSDQTGTTPGALH